MSQTSGDVPHIGTVGVAALAVPLVWEDSHSTRHRSRGEDNPRLDASAPFRFRKPFFALAGKSAFDSVKMGVPIILFSIGQFGLCP